MTNVDRVPCLFEVMCEVLNKPDVRSFFERVGRFFENAGRAMQEALDKPEVRSFLESVPNVQTPDIFRHAWVPCRSVDREKPLAAKKPIGFLGER